jgi:hypothetical protein
LEKSYKLIPDLTDKSCFKLDDRSLKNDLLNFGGVGRISFLTSRLPIKETIFVFDFAEIIAGAHKI